MPIDSDFDQLRSAHAHVVRATLPLVADLQQSDLTRVTPCSGWTVGDLLEHMTTQHRGFAAAARGSGSDLDVWKRATTTVDPGADYGRAAEDVLSAFAGITNAGSPFALPEISATIAIPARIAVGFHFIDYLVHGWDLAESLDLSYRPDADLVDIGLPIAERVPAGEARTRPGAAFAPVTGSDSTDPFDRILALLGRSYGWRDRIY